MEYIIRSGSLKHFPDLMVELGQNPIRLLEDSGIEPAALRDPDTYISYLRMARLLDNACATCRRSDIGALLAMRYGLDMIGALAPLISLQATVGRALELIQRHIGFHARGLVFDTERGPDEVAVRVEFEFAGRVNCTQLATLAMGALRLVLGQLAGGRAFPVSVGLRRTAPPDDSVYRELFGPSIQYRQSADCMRFPAELLDQPVQVEALLRERMGRVWRQFGLDVPVSLTQQIERAIRASLPTGDCNLEQVARMVDLHPRVLQNRLRDEGKRFRDVLQSVRTELACQHLQHGDLSLTQLALNLGYSEVSALSRSFRSWTGESPLAWRLRHRA